MNRLALTTLLAASLSTSAFAQTPPTASATPEEKKYICENVHDQYVDFQSPYIMFDEMLQNALKAKQRTVDPQTMFMCNVPYVEIILGSQYLENIQELRQAMQIDPEVREVFLKKMDALYDVTMAGLQLCRQRLPADTFEPDASLSDIRPLINDTEAEMKNVYKVFRWRLEECLKP